MSQRACWEIWEITAVCVETCDFPHLAQKTYQSRRDSSGAAIPHPGLSICLCGPGKQMPGKLFVWYVPMRAVLVFTQPAGNLLRSPSVVDFDDDERALLRKKLRSSAQDFVLTTLHVDLH